jgi:hypothetical protein
MTVRQASNRRQIRAQWRRIIPLEARQVRVFLDRPLDSRGAAKNGRPIAETCLDLCLESVRLEQRRDASNQSTKRLLPIGLEFDLN